MAEVWQKSLRRSTGEVPKNLGRTKRNSTTGRLASVTEDEVFGPNDENENLARAKGPAGPRARRRLSTKEDQDQVQVQDQARSRPSLTRSPTKKITDYFLKKLPPPKLTLALPPNQDSMKNIPSPIPLPPGVFSKLKIYLLFSDRKYLEYKAS